MGLEHTTVSVVKTSKLKRSRQSKWLPYVLLAPLMLFIGVLSLYPTVLTFVKSFYNVNPLNPPTKFVGFKNFIDVLKDPTIMASWGNTFWYVLFGVGLSTILALVIALGLRDGFKGRAIVLAILILPWALPGVTEGIIWNWIFDPSFGVLNSVLKSLHIIHNYHVWLSGSRIMTILFIEIVQVWQMTPLSVILILASLQSIPNELYDAARVDGAGRWKTIFQITIPLISPGLAVAVIESLIISLNVFDQVYVLNGQANTGVSVMVQTYNVTFQNLNFGQGYALSFLAMVVTMLASVAVLKFIYREVSY